MKQENCIVVIHPEELVAKALFERQQGSRLSQICAVRTETGYELSYSFVLGYDMINYRLIIDEDTEVVSICDIFPSSVLYENEMVELFGVNIKFMNLDYHNKLYKIDQETPFK